MSAHDALVRRRAIVGPAAVVRAPSAGGPFGPVTPRPRTSRDVRAASSRRSMPASRDRRTVKTWKRRAPLSVRLTQLGQPDPRRQPVGHRRAASRTVFLVIVPTRAARDSGERLPGPDAWSRTAGRDRFGAPVLRPAARAARRVPGLGRRAHGPVAARLSRATRCRCCCSSARTPSPRTAPARDRLICALARSRCASCSLGVFGAVRASNAAGLFVEHRRLRGGVLLRIDDAEPPPVHRAARSTRRRARARARRGSASARSPTSGCASRRSCTTWSPTRWA